MRQVVFDTDLPLTQEDYQAIAEHFTEDDNTEFVQKHPFVAILWFAFYPEKVKSHHIAIFLLDSPATTINHFAHMLTPQQIAELVDRGFAEELFE